MTTRRVAVIGAGQVWRRLYQPAFALVPGLQLVAIADPANPGPFTNPAEMLESTKLDAVVVLSPPKLHGEHVALGLSRGLQVLVEKPPALSLAEVAAWESAGGASLVRPAFSRRYWPRYGISGRTGHRWHFRLETNPASWAATTTEPVERDLLPHAADLARWLSGEEVIRVRVAERSAEAIAGVFELGQSGEFLWRVAHGAAYRETLTMDGAALGSGDGALARLRRRLTRAPAQDIAGIAGMLRDWALAIGGSSPSRLPTFADARANVEVIERVLQSPVEPTP